MPAVIDVRETRTMTRVLLDNGTVPAGQERRLRPSLDVRPYDRLHIHVGRDGKAVDRLAVRVLFATPLQGLHCNAILADSTVWFEESVSEREFTWAAPPGYGRTGFVVSVPVVAPELYDVILRNTGTQPLDAVYVTVMAQEI